VRLERRVRVRELRGLRAGSEEGRDRGAVPAPDRGRDRRRRFVRRGPQPRRGGRVGATMAADPLRCGQEAGGRFYWLEYGFCDMKIFGPDRPAA